MLFRSRQDNRSGRHLRRNGAIALPAYTGGVGQCTVYYDNIVVTRIAEASEAQAGSGN